MISTVKFNKLTAQRSRIDSMAETKMATSIILAQRLVVNLRVSSHSDIIVTSWLLSTRSIFRRYLLADTKQIILLPSDLLNK